MRERRNRRRGPYVIASPWAHSAPESSAIQGTDGLYPLMSQSSSPSHSFFILWSYATECGFKFVCLTDTYTGGQDGCKLVDIWCGDSWTGSGGCCGLQKGSEVVGRCLTKRAFSRSLWIASDVQPGTGSIGSILFVAGSTQCCSLKSYTSLVCKAFMKA